MRSDTASLSAEEIVNAQRFLFEEDRAQYVRSHIMMRYLLGLLLRCRPQDIQFSSSTFGKPILRDQGSGLQFSLSHTSSHAMLAVAHSPVGVDLEHVRPVDSSIAAMHFSEMEQAQLARYRGEDWTRCFFRCWTRKEALLKAEGIGLNLPLECFDVEIAHDAMPALLGYRVPACFTRAWKLHDISPRPELIAAVAVSPEIQQLKLFLLQADAVE